jgi:hypothetical protein
MESHGTVERARIGISIDTYDDIFSDFDPRPYAQRALSDDFLFEVKKAAVEKGDQIELRFLIPAIARNLTHEATIRKRLREHFQKHADILEREYRKDIRGGALTACIGFALILVATYVHNESSFLGRLLMVIVEPSGWFAMWYGFDRIFYTGKETRPERGFYAKMAKAQVTFEAN